jgi:hypothetical protein
MWRYRSHGKLQAVRTGLVQQPPSTCTSGSVSQNPLGMELKFQDIGSLAEARAGEAKAVKAVYAVMAVQTGAVKSGAVRTGAHVWAEFVTACDTLVPAAPAPRATASEASVCFCTTAFVRKGAGARRWLRACIHEKLRVAGTQVCGNAECNLSVGAIRASCKPGHLSAMCSTCLRHRQRGCPNNAGHADAPERPTCAGYPVMCTSFRNWTLMRDH